MRRKLMKGNDATVCGALLAGCQSFYGYPITPATEIAETAARLFPLAGRTFIQAESEVAAINMVLGASSAGVRTMTASSGPGISLKMEGISYLAASELPAVIVDICRAGPGLGNIYPDQSDYNQIVKGGGHGSYRCIVLAPNSVQEMCDFTIRAFDLADRYRIPVFILSDAYVGQMMEPVALPEPSPPPTPKPWALTTEPETNDNVITSIYLDANDLERHVLHLQDTYAQIEAAETDSESIETEDADLLLVGYGITSRLLQNIVEQARADGYRVGLFRPKTLWPFPKEELGRLVGRVKGLLCVELSNGQMVDDVRLIFHDRCPVEFLGRLGGNMPSVQDIEAKLREMLERTE